MSVSFGNLNISNGEASRLLREVGCNPGEGTEGEKPVEDLLAGIQKAKEAGDHSEYLGYLEAEVMDAQARGETTFEWF